MKRFYKEAAIDENNLILLDSKPITSPAKNKLTLPNARLAQAIADEWRMQGETIDKAKLPLTGMASLALDIAIPRRDELLDELLEYGETDLLFYRSEEKELAKTQHVQWQPWINHAQVTFSTRYEITDSIMPITQVEGNRSKHRKKLETLNEWQLALLAAVIKPTTSMLLGWFFLHKELDDEELFTLSQLEETFNIEKWGEDAETKQKAEAIRNDLKTATLWRNLL